MHNSSKQEQQLTSSNYPKQMFKLSAQHTTYSDDEKGYDSHLSHSLFSF